MSDYLNKRRDWILAGKPETPKVKKAIPKVSKKRAEKLAAQKDENGDTELQKWFRGRMKFMGHSCKECGMKAETGIYQYAIHHICHILPKRENMCPSVRVHPLNFITLCSDHHNQFDSYGYDDKGWAEREKMACWELVKERLIMIYPSLDPSEHRHFPTSVLNWMEQHNPFPDKK